MSSICPNCNSRLSCGCQKRTASNGVTVCTMCITRFEADLAAKKNKAAQSVITTTPGSPNAPTNIQATYNPPKQ